MDGRRRDFASFEKLRDLFFARRSERNSGFLKFIKKIGKLLPPQQQQLYCILYQVLAMYTIKIRPYQ